MLKRIIPILLVDSGDLIKTVKFNTPNYIGDLLVSLKIYNELEVDEICILDKSASKNGIDLEQIRCAAEECFVPVSYGGGISKIEQIKEIVALGVEKVIICSALLDYLFVEEAVKLFGSSTIVASIDYREINGEHYFFTANGSKNTGITVQTMLNKLSSIGVGEIILQSIDKDGTYSGLDVEFVQKVLSVCRNPIVVAGGCSDITDIKKAFDIGVSGVAVGSLFVYYTNAKGILINYPDNNELKENGIER